MRMFETNDVRVSIFLSLCPSFDKSFDNKYGPRYLSSLSMVTPSNLSSSVVLIVWPLMSTDVRDGSCFLPITMAWYLLISHHVIFLVPR